MIPKTFPTIDAKHEYDDTIDDFARTLGVEADGWVSSGEADNGGANFLGLLSSEEMMALGLIDAIQRSHTVTGFAASRQDHYAAAEWEFPAETVFAIDAWTSSGFHTLETYDSEADYETAVEGWEAWARGYWEDDEEIA